MFQKNFPSFFRRCYFFFSWKTEEEKKALTAFVDVFFEGHDDNEHKNNPFGSDSYLEVSKKS